MNQLATVHLTQPECDGYVQSQKAKFRFRIGAPSRNRLANFFCRSLFCMARGTNGNINGLL